MPTPVATMTVRHERSHVAVIDIGGEVTSHCDDVLAEAYEEASTGGTTGIVLNFAGLDYMNSGGIGMLVTLLVRANRNKQRLAACGLTPHYRQIFELTRLDEAISLHPDEDAAIAAL
ncbi:MAG: anti-sigma factor antagonist [Frankiales bacterium]|nr:anti-sigma factor antagonist [Frankiales bacterium]